MCSWTLTLGLQSVYPQATLHIKSDVHKLCADRANLNFVIFKTNFKIGLEQDFPKVEHSPANNCL